MRLKVFISLAGCWLDDHETNEELWGINILYKVTSGFGCEVDEICALLYTSYFYFPCTKYRYKYRRFGNSHTIVTRNKY